LLAVNGRAKEELKRILSAKAGNPQAVVRLITSHPGEFGLVMDMETPDDNVVEYEDSKVLLVNHELASSLEEYTLAFEDKKFVMAKGPLSGFNKSVVMFNGKERK
jgi:hypothetical protein